MYVFIYTLINICKSIGKELWKIQRKLIILSTSWKVTRDISVLLELFTTIMCLCENELCHYVNSVIVIVSWSLLGRYSGILSSPAVLLQRMLLQALWSCSALAPRSRPQHVAAWGPASHHGFGSRLPLCYGLCCMGPLIPTLDWASSLGTLVPPSD